MELKMTNERPPIPSELRRRVLIESGHRCAIPTCRHIEVDVHHIIPWEQCKRHEYENLIALCPNCHRRAGRNEIDRKSLRIYKANLRFTHDKFSQLEVDVLFELYHLPENKVLLWPEYMYLLIKRLLDADYVEFRENPNRAVVGPIKLQPDFLVITGKGREYIDSLSVDKDL